MRLKSWPDVSRKLLDVCTFISVHSLSASPLSLVTGQSAKMSSHVSRLRFQEPAFAAWLLQDGAGEGWRGMGGGGGTCTSGGNVKSKTLADMKQTACFCSATTQSASLCGRLERQRVQLRLLRATMSSACKLRMKLEEAA